MIANSGIKSNKTFKTFNLTNFFVITLGLISALVGLACLSVRVPMMIYEHKNEVELFLARLFFQTRNSGNKFFEAQNKSSFENITFEDPLIPEPSSSEDSNSSSVAEDTEESNHAGEKTYKIIESQIGASGRKYDNFYLKKNTNMDVNIEHELTLRPDINIKKDGTPQVLIYHTHTTESYMKKDQDFYYESFYPRSTDNNYNVTQVGNAIEEKLKSNGIGVIHDTTTHDSPSYNGSYGRSVKTIEKNLSQYPSIQVTLDIHRDSLGGNDTGKIKPTFKVGNKKAAQIMIMAGCDEDGSLEFPDWEYNLRFALKLQNAAETLYPGMTRPMYFGDVRYNMHMTHGSLLIEVGSDVNSLEEAKYSGTLLGDALAKVLNELS